MSKRQLTANRPHPLLTLLSEPAMFVLLVEGDPFDLLNLLRTTKALAAVIVPLVASSLLGLLRRVVTVATGEPSFAFYVWQFHCGTMTYFREAMTLVTNPECACIFNIVSRCLLDSFVFALYEKGLASFRNRNILFSHHVGNGADIFSSSTTPTERHTPMSELCRYLATSVHLLNKRLIDEQPSQEIRSHLSALVSHLSPYTLGSFALCDTRRLSVHACACALLADLVAHVATLDKVGNRKTFLRKVTVFVTSLFPAQRDEAAAFYKNVVTCARKLSDENILVWSQKYKEYLAPFTKDPVVALGRIIEEFPAVAFTRLQPLLAEAAATSSVDALPLPPIEHFEQKLMALYVKEPLLARNMLVYEMRHVASVRGKK